LAKRKRLTGKELGGRRKFLGVNKRNAIKQTSEGMMQTIQTSANWKFS
jgi:hypothetical protein